MIFLTYLSSCTHVWFAEPLCPAMKSLLFWTSPASSLITSATWVLAKDSFWDCLISKFPWLLCRNTYICMCVFVCIDVHVFSEFLISEAHSFQYNVLTIYLGATYDNGMLSGQRWISQCSSCHSPWNEKERLGSQAATDILPESMPDDTNQACLVHQTWFRLASRPWHWPEKESSSCQARWNIL